MGLSIKVNYKFYRAFQEENAQIEKAVEECQAGDNTDQGYLDYCESLKDMKTYKQDFFSAFSSMIIFELKLLNPLVFLFIFIPTISILYRRLNYGYFINVNNRESYKQSLKSFFRDAYRYI